MLRFIDLRYQGTGDRFAFYCTSSDTFEDLDGMQSWSTWEEFETDYESIDPSKRPSLPPLTRYKRLCPRWVFVSPTEREDELDIDGCVAFVEIAGERYPLDLSADLRVALLQIASAEIA